MSATPSVDGAIQSVISAKQASVSNQIGYAVASKQLDATKQQGQAAIALLETAAQLSKAVGKGGQFDAQG